MAGFWHYLGECLRILYWAYFKPYSLGRWLHGIHTRIKPTDNPFTLRGIPANQRLSRYAGQVRWISTVIPMLFTLLIAPIYSLTSVTGFNWFLCGLFLVGWLIGIWLGCSKLEILKTWFQYFLWLLLGLVLLFVVSVRFAPEGVRSLLQAFPVLMAILTHFFDFFALGSGIALGIVLGVGNGVAIGVAVGIAGSVAFGGMVNLTSDVGLGIAGGISSSILVGIAIGVAGSLLVDVASGIAGAIVGSVLGCLAGSLEGGIAFGIAIICGILRFYFWLPEVLWLAILFVISGQGKEVKYIRYLPPWFDQLIRLPLPFMDKMLIEAYDRNPTVACRTINYLLNLTNQQKVATQAISSIALKSFNQCRTLPEIVAVYEQLNWIPALPSPEFNSVLSKFLEISQNLRAVATTTSANRQLELLALPINSVTYLWHQLLLSNDATLSKHFTHIAEKWLRILQTKQRSLEAQVQQ